MPNSQLTSKGQITLPKAIREHLNVKNGDVVSFSVEKDGRVTVTAANSPVSSLKGIVAAPASPVSIEDMNRAVRQKASQK